MRDEPAQDGPQQGSVFHQQGDLVDPHVLKSRADLLGTTSPSVLLYAGLDGRTQQVPIEQAAGRVAAEMLTPYPPAIPAALPGERLSESVIEYLRTGVAAGMVIPDAVDPELSTVRVLHES